MQRGLILPCGLPQGAMSWRISALALIYLSTTPLSTTPAEGFITKLLPLCSLGTQLPRAPRAPRQGTQLPSASARGVELMTTFSLLGLTIAN